MIKPKKSEVLFSLLYSIKDCENIDEYEIELLKNIMIYTHIENENLNIEKMIRNKDIKEKIHKWIEYEIKELCIR